MNALLPDNAVGRVLTVSGVYSNPEGVASSAPPDGAVLPVLATYTSSARTPTALVDLGYIASRVTVNGEGAAGRRVVLLGPDMAAQGTTFSDAQGNYRFDHLLLTRRYLVLAQDTFAFDYAPVAADLLTPTPYFSQEAP